jgi:release factor glutamine methyltransferase
MGTGSGALAVYLARRGAEVTAIDINPMAVRCARANASLHGLEGRMRVLEGDLFAPIAGQRFDLILFNPPFYERPARGMADRAWTGGVGNETLWRFLRAAPCHLRPGGEVLVAGSTEAPYTRRLRHAVGYRVRLIGRRELVGEQLFLFALRPL